MSVVRQVSLDFDREIQKMISENLINRKVTSYPQATKEFLRRLKDGIK